MKNLSLTICLIISLNVFCQTSFTVNNINYTTTWGNSVEVSNGSYSGDIIIPSNVSYLDVNYNVNFIGSNAFSECYNLKSVSIPTTVQYIGNGAFSYCSG